MIFLSANVANFGNLAFNMIFSRLLGPEAFGALATLLTLKLAILALLNSLQMAISQKVSQGQEAGVLVAVRRLGGWCFAGLFLVSLALLPFVVWGGLGEALGLPQWGMSSLAVLLLALPVTAPLCIGRGVATGRLATGPLVLSVQLEMLVRLLGGVLAYVAGWGLTGVVAALALSLLAGWWPVARPNGAKPVKKTVTDRRIVNEIILLSLPFGLLQVSQVALLDGDILASTLMLGAQEAGLVAVLGLFQRVQFFACFGLAAALLPAVTLARRNGHNGRQEMRPILFLFGATVLPLVAGSVLMPDRLVGLLAGPAFAAASPLLLPTVLAAASFTLSYLAVTYLTALGDRRGLMLMAAAVPVQFGAYVALAQVMDDFGLTHLVLAKLTVQVALAASLCLLALRGSAAAQARQVVAPATGPQQG